MAPTDCNRLANWFKINSEFEEGSAVYQFCVGQLFLTWGPWRTHISCVVRFQGGGGGWSMNLDGRKKIYSFIVTEL